MISLGKKALEAKDFLASVTEKQKNEALKAIADALRENSKTIIEANKIDIENGEKAGLNKGLIDRLMLDEKRINDIADSVINVINPAQSVLSRPTVCRFRPACLWGQAAW